MPVRRLLALVLALVLGLGLVGPGAALARDDPAQRGRWRAPVRPPIVVRDFDPPAQPWLAGHRGLDLLVRPGVAVHAAGAGRVRHAAPVAGRPVVVIGHGPLRTTYEPVVATVRVGQRVRAGQAFGTVDTGGGHCGSGRCLHLGLRRGTQYLDPRLLLGSRAVLLPWEAGPGP